MTHLNVRSAVPKIFIALTVILAVLLCACADSSSSGNSEPIDVEIAHSFYKGNGGLLSKPDHIEPADDNTTLKLSITSRGRYDNAYLKVSIPTASNLEVVPQFIQVGVIGQDEIRSHSFKIESMGQDNGSYNVIVEAYDTSGNYSSVYHNTTIYVGEIVSTPGMSASAALMALLAALFLIRRRIIR